ncbi:MAG: GIY-YIG nuclease family protein [Chromatiaceae bacterium]|nr:GIY-YIG nuclease family protein [Chromatiaceae bacterium]
MNLLELPIVSIHDKTHLPKISGVYIVLNESGDPLYVGQSENIKRRLTRGHHCDDDIKQMGNVFISWVAVDKEDLLSTEKHFIDSLNPAWNKAMGGARPGAGRKPGPHPDAAHRIRRLVMLNDVEVEMAKNLGGGNISKGVRNALEFLRTTA